MTIPLNFGTQPEGDAPALGDMESVPISAEAIMKIDFVGVPLTVLLTSDKKWELTKPFKVIVNNSTVIVPAGFRTDFASVPRLAFVYALFGNMGFRAATLHDWLYTGQDTVPFSRKHADLILRYALIADGVPAWKAWAMWMAVQAFGGKHFTENAGCSGR